MQKLTTWSGVAVLLSLTCVIGHAFQEKRSFADVALYEAVLDQLFAYERDRDGTQITTTLRYIDGESGEMQLSIALVPSVAQYRIERWRVPKGSPSIWQQMVQLAASNTALNLQAAVRTIRVDHATGRVSAESSTGRLLRKGASLHVELSGSNEFFLHGADYQIRIASPGRDIRLRLRGPQDGGDSSDHIIQWMAQVRRTLADVDLQSVGPDSP